uniref:EF-hand domain-containing protein n=2 Tax=Lotharella oceanica TaxID=641309 RepID=A0A7S2XB20_9EUKA|mmetsp:Transcript_26258/g.49001  ORF Transcript_26258/g.49001 Transcript_26258/m.49001 type:complete len:254 (+) Transcript_26258:67-828(+)
MGAICGRETRNGRELKYVPASKLEEKLQKVIKDLHATYEEKQTTKALFTKIQLNFPKYKVAFDSVRSLYDKLDANNDGGMDLQEFVIALKQMGADLKEEDAKQIFEGVDINHDKSLSFKEFLVCMAIGYIIETIPSFPDREKFHEAFESAIKLFMSYDKHTMGVVEDKEMEGYVKELGGETVIHERMKELDPDSDGFVTFIEFLYAFQDWVGVEDEEDDVKESVDVQVSSKAAEKKTTQKKHHKKTASNVHFN